MLIVQMPEGGKQQENQRRRKRRAVGYMIAVLPAMVAGFIAPNLGIECFALLLELWILWAVLTDPNLKR